MNMSDLAKKTADMIDMLPLAEQALAFEMMKRIVLAWDPDFTKATPKEAAEIRQAEEELARGEFVSEDEIDWDAP